LFVELRNVAKLIPLGLQPTVDVVLDSLLQQLGRFLVEGGRHYLDIGDRKDGKQSLQIDSGKNRRVVFKANNANNSVIRLSQIPHSKALKVQEWRKRFFFFFAETMKKIRNKKKAKKGQGRLKSTRERVIRGGIVCSMLSVGISQGSEEDLKGMFEDQLNVFPWLMRFLEDKVIRKRDFVRVVNAFSESATIVVLKTAMDHHFQTARGIAGHATGPVGHEDHLSRFVSEEHSGGGWGVGPRGAVQPNTRALFQPVVGHECVIGGEIGGKTHYGLSAAASSEAVMEEDERRVVHQLVGCGDAVPVLHNRFRQLSFYYNQVRQISSPQLRFLSVTSEDVRTASRGLILVILLFPTIKKKKERERTEKRKALLIRKEEEEEKYGE
jgi:hypothetical protein